MRIEPGTVEHLRYVAENMRESDVREFLALSPAQDKAELARSIVAAFGRRRDMIAAMKSGVPIAVGAAMENRPNVLSLLFFATDEFPRIAAPLTSFIVRRLFPPLVAAGAHRIECASHEDHKAAHRWIGILGLSREAVMEGFGKNGETFYQFSWVREDVRTLRQG